MRRSILQFWQTEACMWLQKVRSHLVDNWGIIKKHQEIAQCNLRASVPPDGCGVTPKSLVLHTQQVLATQVGRARCLESQVPWEPALAGYPALGEGQPKRHILWGCWSEGHRRVGEREGWGAGFHVFYF